MTPITINNHFPDRAFSSSSTVPPGKSGSNPATDPLELPSPLDKAMQDYSEWHKTRVSDPLWKADIDNACDVVLAQRRNLRQIYADRDTFLREKDIPVGVAKRFADDVPLWNKKRRCEI